MYHRRERVTSKNVETLERIDRAEHLLQGAAVGFKLVAELLTVSDESMATSRKPLPVDLIPMAQPWLHHAITTIDLQDETVDVGDEIFVDLGQMRRHDAAEK